MEDIKTTRSDFIYEIQDLMQEHGITLQQTMYLLCRFHNIEWELAAADLLPLIQKRLLTTDLKPNSKVVFRDRQPAQQELGMSFSSQPKSSDETLKLAHNLEKKLVFDKYLTEDYKKEIADKYFKGDLTVARYFIIFKALFPVRDKKKNGNWNRHFGIVFDDMSRWDNHVRVSKKFHEIYRKRDIGIFLAGTYYYVRDTIDEEYESCFVSKPYKYLNSYETWYELAEEKMEEQKNKAVSKNEDKDKDKLRTL